MKHLTRIVAATLLLLLSISLTVIAEPAPELTDEQRAQIESIMQDHRQKKEALQQDLAGRLQEVLTPEQFEVLQQRRAKAQDRHQKQRGYARVLRELELTPEQKEQFRAEVQEVFSSERERKSELREQMKERLSAILTPEQREKLETLEGHVEKQSTESD